MQYQDLKRYMGGNEAFSLDGVTLKEVRNAVLQIRAAKGMVLLKGYDGFKSAGSFFKNPTIDDSFFKEVSIKVGASGGCLNWAWPTTDGKVKVSAACMIELAGFVRGYRAGNVGVSPKHTLSLINYGGGTAREVLSLAKDIREAVFEKYGVTLETEVNMLGFNATDFI